MSNPVPGFNGERADPLNHTYPLGNGYRAYNPRLRCFHCPDGWSPFGAGGINSYAYCAGDPVNRADPSGHHSLGGWLGIGVGVALGLLLTPVSGGSSLAVALSAVSVTAAMASAGLAVAQQFVERTDPGTASALGWAALGTGIASALSVTALCRVVPGARSLVSLLKGTSNRPLAGLMMSGEGFVNEGVAPSGGQFSHPRFLGVYSDPAIRPEHLLAFSYLDSPSGYSRLNIVGQAALTTNRTFAVGSGEWFAGRYAPVKLGYSRVAHIIHEEITKFPAIRSVRLLVPQAGGVIKSGTGAFYSRVKGALRGIYNRPVSVSGPEGWLELSGDAASELRDLQGSLSINEYGNMVTTSGELFSPRAAQINLNAIADRYGDMAQAFRVVNAEWVPD